MFKKDYTLLGVSLVFLLALSACGSGIAPSEPPISTTETKLPSTKAYQSATAEVNSPTPPAPAKLKVEEYALLRNTMVGETVVSKPLEGTWEEILATHAALREDHFPKKSISATNFRLAQIKYPGKFSRPRPPMRTGRQQKPMIFLSIKTTACF